MLCKRPFARDPRGKMRWKKKLSEDELLDMTFFGCKKCLPCRINMRRIWTHRILLEAESHLKSCFITLTYTDDFLPINKNGDMILIKRHLQNYVKRLRRKFNNGTIRYYGIGEYGDLFDRPHYHICLFGLGESDIEVITNSWHHKGENIGKVDSLPLVQETAQYIAGYTIKKLTKEADYRLFGRTPEFSVSSKQNGGIGIEGIRRIARELSKNPHISPGNIPKSFNFGSKSYPLGSYLSGLLEEEYKTDSIIQGEYEDFEQERKRGLLDFQKRILLKTKNSDNYYQKIIDDSSRKIKEIEIKHKIIQQRKKAEKLRRYNAKKKQSQPVS